MATHPQMPKPKSNKTVTFVGDDGNELEVIVGTSKANVARLKRLGYTRKPKDSPPPKEAPEEEETQEESTPAS